MKGKGILVIFVTIMMFANLHHLIYGIELTPEDIEHIDLLSYVANLTLAEYANYTIEVGQLAGKGGGMAGHIDRDSIVNRLAFAYHIGYPADPDYWGSAFTHVDQEFFTPLQQIRKTQAAWEEIKNYESRCAPAVKLKLDAKEGAFLPEVDTTLVDCLDKTKYEYVEDQNKFETLINASRLNAVFILAAEYNFMLFLHEYGYEADDINDTDTYEIRLGPINRMADEANLDHYEVTRRVKDFQDRIDDPTAKLSPERRRYFQEKLDEIKEELLNPPFNWIYSNGDEGPVELRRDCNNHLIQELEAKYGDLFNWIYETDTAVQWVEGNVPIDWDVRFPAVRKETLQFYFTYFHVAYNSSTKEFVWDWDVQDANSCAKFVRDSWERLDKIVERMKCYMVESYYFSEGVRQRALRLTQLDLAESKLFSNISTTLFKPCRITDDSDLVSTCSRENHEICAPMFFYKPILQNPKYDTHGGVSLLRPKAYYKFDKDSNQCEPVKTFIVPYKMCQCGFRMDCGNDLGGNLTCHLTADFLRKQCRGTTAYPCKSMPLAPGRHHESCLSGYCDMEMNSCEDGPPLSLQKTSRGYDLNINHWPITISVISVIFTLKIQYYGHG